MKQSESTSVKPTSVKFKFEGKIIEAFLEGGWTIGNIKGKIRKKLRVNLFYDLQLIYRGEVLDIQKKFKDLNYDPEFFIKVLLSRTTDM